MACGPAVHISILNNIYLLNTFFFFGILNISKVNIILFLYFKYSLYFTLKKIYLLAQITYLFRIWSHYTPRWPKCNECNGFVSKLERMILDMQCWQLPPGFQGDSRLEMRKNCRARCWVLPTTLVRQTSYSSLAALAGLV